MEALKAEMQKLLQQRSAIESEIQDRTNRLNAPGQPGMTGSLLDKEVSHLLPRLMFFCIATCFRSGCFGCDVLTYPYALYTCYMLGGSAFILVMYACVMNSCAPRQ